MSFQEKSVENLRKQFKGIYTNVEQDMEGNIVSISLGDFAKDIWESIGEDGILKGIDYNPCDSMGGSLSFYIASLSEDYFLRLWYSGKDQAYYFAFCKKLSGNLVHQIPDTFNADGIAKVANLDQFVDYFLTFLAKEKYNLKHKLAYGKSKQPLLG